MSKRNIKIIFGAVGILAALVFVFSSPMGLRALSGAQAVNQGRATSGGQTQHQAVASIGKQNIRSSAEGNPAAAGLKPADVAKQIATLQAELAQIRQAQLAEAKAVRGNQGADWAEFGDPALAENPAEAETRAASAMQAELALMEDTVQQEEIDAHWAGAAESSLSDAFANAELDAVSLSTAECRATLCRLEVAPAGSAGAPGGFEVALERFLLRTPWSAPALLQIQESDDGSPRAVVYLAREGYALPQSGALP